MNYIRITKENIDREHICCAMSGKQSIAKKEWLRQRFEEGLVFYRSEERGKCFIEYIPAENAWVPIMADGWLYINCLWVSGSMKGHGYSNDLLEECIRDARAQGKNGLCGICRLCPMRNRRGSGNAQSIRQLQKPVSSCITPISALTPITGFQGCRRQQRSTGSRSGPSTSRTKNPRRTFPRRSRPMRCSGTASF